MKEARIHTRFGEFSISFQTTDELKEVLKDLAEQAKTIQEVADKIAPPSPRTAKPGYETVYRFSPNGSLELLIMPEKRNEAAALVLYAYHPEPVSSADIELATGIKDVASRVLSLAQNKEHFQKIDDKYGLTFAGIRMVIERISSTLRQPTEQDQQESKYTKSEQAK